MPWGRYLWLDAMFRGSVRELPWWEEGAELLYKCQVNAETGGSLVHALDLWKAPVFREII
jgi:hypothetical protein